METIAPTQRRIGNWRTVLSEEQRFCEDADYAKHLSRILPNGSSGFSRRRPYAAEVEAALRTACDAHGGIRFYWQRRLDRLDKAKKKSTPVSKLVANLQDNHWFERFLSRHILLYRGGEAIESLLELCRIGSSEEQSLAVWLILSICKETEERLAKEADNLLCSHCVTRCIPLEIELPQEGKVEYYGCRICHQSIDFQMWPEQGVVAVLDRRTRKEKIKAKDQIRVNWLTWRKLFDFDCVEVIEATDEDVERFAVQVGNDTNERQDSRYEKMVCTVSSNCDLSENTMRVLGHTFGSVGVKELA